MARSLSSLPLRRGLLVAGLTLACLGGSVASASAFPGISISPGGANFGSVPRSHTSAPQEFTVEDSGDAPLVITSATLVGANTSQFAITTDTCAPVTLQPGEQCHISATLTPTEEGPLAAEVQLADNAGLGTQGIRLSGELDVLSVTPASPFGFGDVLVGSLAQEDFTIENVSNSTVDLEHFFLFGSRFSDVLGTCAGASLAPSQSCVLTIQFEPSAPGLRNGFLQIGDGHSHEPQMVFLNGTGIAPEISVTPASHDFGSIPVGSVSSEETFSIENTGSADLELEDITVDGSEFSDLTGGCAGTGRGLGEGKILAPGESCLVTVGFHPHASGLIVSDLYITSNASPSPKLVEIKGTGTEPSANVTPSTFGFGGRDFGSTTSQTFTLTDSGNEALVIGGDSIVGVTADQFNITADTCAGVTVLPTQTCAVTVAFTPRKRPRRPYISSSMTMPLTPHRKSLLRVPASLSPLSRCPRVSGSLAAGT